MSYNGKNYAEQGGDKWVIGGTSKSKRVPLSPACLPLRFPKRPIRLTVWRRMSPLWF